MGEIISQDVSNRLKRSLGHYATSQKGNYNHFVKKDLISICSFGDSLTNGTFNQSGQYFKGYPFLLQEKLADNINKGATNKSGNFYKATNQVLGGNCTYSNGIYTMVLGSTPSFMLDTMSVFNDDIVSFSFDADTSQMTASNFCFRVKLLDSSNNVLDDRFTVFNYQSTGFEHFENIIDLNVENKTFNNQVSKIVLGVLIYDGTSAMTVQIKNVNVGYTNNICTQVSTRKSGDVTTKSNSYTLKASQSNGGQATISTPILAIQNGEYYVLDIDYDTSQNTEGSLSMSIGCLHVSDWLTQIDDNTYTNKDTKTGKIRYVISADYILKLRPTANKISPTLTFYAYNSQTMQQCTITKFQFYKLVQGVKVVNEGISGQTTTDAIARINTITDKGYDYVIVGFGTNDLNYGSTTIDTYINNLKTIVDTLKTNGITPILMNIPPLKNDKASLVPVWNDRLKTFADGNNIELIDRYRGFSTLFDTDGIHFVSDGYNLCANVVYNFLTGKTRFE
jgi:acyl-CoA thioesterase-1